MVCRDGVQETQLPSLPEPQILLFDTAMEQNQEEFLHTLFWKHYNKTFFFF